MAHRDHASAQTLADHAEGLLNERDARRVGAHLEWCAGCRSKALMLDSLPAILAAADPGPMPARYVARTNAALARLAITEPVTPGNAARPPIADTRGAQVIDVVSRRQLMTTGLRRVSTGAAAVVLLIGGAALGVQTIGNHGRPSSPDVAQSPRPNATEQATEAAEVFDIPKDAVPDKHGNYVLPKLGTIYVPSIDKPNKTARKVIRPDGVEIVPDAKGNPIYLPPHTTKRLGPPRPATTPQPNPTTPPAGRGSVSAPPPPVPPNQPPPAGPPATGPGSGDRPVRPTDPDPAQGEPYVTQSGAAYDEDNFAGKVMDLVAAAEQNSNPDTNRPEAAEGEAVDPAAPPYASPIRTSAQRFGDRRNRTAGAPSATTAIEPAARPSTSSDLQDRVLRCAAQTGHRAIAGDQGHWGDRRATVVVVRSDNPDQVIGYVFYGRCNRSGPVTARESPWEQQVDRPDTQPTAPQPTAPQPTALEPTAPPKKVDDRSSSDKQAQVNSSTPASAPPVGANPVMPSQDLS
jgi:hypothetical protein